MPVFHIYLNTHTFKTEKFLKLQELKKEGRGELLLMLTAHSLLAETGTRPPTGTMQLILASKRSQISYRYIQTHNFPSVIMQAPTGG